MLLEITLVNLALVEELHLALPPGFTALTGETGAGKSLLLTALSLLRGERASPELIRAGKEEAVVEGLLVPGDPRARERLKEEGYDPGEGEILIRRILRRNGQNRVYLNHRLASVQLLEELFSPEILLYSREGEERLFTPRVETALLDRYGGLTQKAGEVAGLWEELRLREQELNQLREEAPRAEREADYLEYTLKELERIAPQPGELEALEERVRLLKGKKRLRELQEGLAERLRHGSPSVLSLLYDVERMLEEGAATQEAWHAPLSEIRELISRIESLSKALAKPGGSEEEGNLAEYEERIQTLKRLVRKYGGTSEALFQEWEKMRKRREELLALAGRIERLEEEIAGLRRRYEEAAKDLSHKRQSTAESLAPRIEAILRDLALPRARFAIQGFLAGPPSPSGLDALEFLFTANPGEPLKPLRRIASGGERSRLLLALYTAIGGEFPRATLVFDELDSGVGGEAAHHIGQLLRKLGEEYQILSVTHTPQVAAYAEHQIQVSKEVRAGETFTRVRPLEGEERLEELARMLGDTEGKEARAYAKKLLKEARRIAA